MEDMDFERRRELRRQKREEMRLEAERLAKNDEDEEEAARERRRRARQDRMKGRDGEEPCGQTEGGTNSHSVIETVSVSSSYSGGGGGGEGGDEEEQALLERMAKREERRQKRMKEALERQRELDGTVTGVDAPGNSGGGGDAAEKNDEEGRQPSWRRGQRDNGEEEEEEEEEEEQQQKPVMYSSSRRREEEEEEEKCEEEEVVEAEVELGGEEEMEPRREEEEEVVEEKPRRSYIREQVSETRPLQDQGFGGNLNSNQGRSSDSPSRGNAETWGEVVEGEGNTDSILENSVSDRNEEDNEVSEILRATSGAGMVNERGGARQERGSQNGGVHEEAPPKQLRKPERTPSRSALRSPEASAVATDNQDEDADARLAERKLEELKRRRDDAESKEFERMRQKQQEAEAQLEELRIKREERRKVLEEEERQRKQEEADRKAKEEEEKRRMKEEIERRRAEAAEKRQKGEEVLDGEGKPFKCLSPRGSSLKIEERTEFLNKSAQRSSVKLPHSPVVSKIDNRLEQYTSAAQRENRESRSPRSGASDLPMVTDGIRSIKSMWEKGNVFGSPGGGAGAYKETAVVKIGVAGRINDWLNKTPESGKTSGGGRPADLKPVDVTNKRSLWENKGTSPTKMTGRGEAKSVANGMGH
ncbi:unnamed protein product [Lota lota]